MRNWNLSAITFYGLTCCNFGVLIHYNKRDNLMGKGKFIYFSGNCSWPPINPNIWIPEIPDCSSLTFEACVRRALDNCVETSGKFLGIDWTQLASKTLCIIQTFNKVVLGSTILGSNDDLILSLHLLGKAHYTSVHFFRHSFRDPIHEIESIVQVSLGFVQEKSSDYPTFEERGVSEFYWFWFDVCC